MKNTFTQILAIDGAEKEGGIKGKSHSSDEIIKYLNKYVLKNVSKIPEKIEYDPHTTLIIKKYVEMLIKD